MRIKLDKEIKCEKCGKLFDDDSNFCFPCRRKQVHEDVNKFIDDLQKAQEATRKSNIHFGPGPNGSYLDKPLIKNITTTKEQMDETIKNANTVINNIPPWKDHIKYDEHPVYKELIKLIEEKETIRLENESLKEKIKLLQEKFDSK